MYDFGRILDHISKPVCSSNAKTLYEALTMFERYFEQNEAFDHYTHGIGPGIVGFVIHAFMEFMGELVNQEIDYNVTGPKKRTPLCVYVLKLQEIVSSVITDETEESSGRLCKVEEKEVVPAKSKSRARTKQTERKELDEGDDVDDVDIVSVSGSEDENNFTTLLGPQGQEYHPPSYKKQQSRFSHKKQPVDISTKIDSLCNVMEQQQSTINHLIKENEMAKNRIRKLKDIKKTSDTKQTKITPTTQQTNASDSDSDIKEVQEVERHKPYSTQPKVVQGSDSGSEDIALEQTTQKKKKKRARIESSSSVGKHVESHELETQDDPDVVMHLRQKKADLEERCKEMEAKILEQNMDQAFRQYQDDIWEEINKFRHALMSAYRKNLVVKKLLWMQEKVCESCVQQSSTWVTQGMWGRTLRSRWREVSCVDRFQSAS